jgi:hypothetical protein
VSRQRRPRSPLWSITDAVVWVVAVLLLVVTLLGAAHAFVDVVTR